MMKRRCLYIFFTAMLMVGYSTSWAQTPAITALDKPFAPVNDTVTISGSGFGSNASDIVVYFGSVSANITSLSDTQIEVLVPAAATFSSISVINTNNGRIGYSPQLFFISFGGNVFDPSLLTGPTTFAAQNGIYDICMCDFDGDGKNDVASSHEGSSLVDVYRNTSTLAAVSFSRSSINIGENTLYISCKEIDGDGLPDLVVTRSGGNSVYVLRNQSTVGSISFGAPLELNTTGAQPRKIAIRDLNLDGNPELIVSNQTTTEVSFFRNLSTPGSIAFSPEATASLPATALNSSGLAVEDLNNDGKPEIIINPFLNANIYIFENNSVVGGSVSFRPVVLFNVSGNLSDLVIGDLDGDNLADIAVSRFLSANISILLNQTSGVGGSLSFGSPRIISTIDFPLGMDLGDLDGDGLADLMVSSASASLDMTLLRNISIPGDFSFERFDIPVNDRSRNVKIGDINGDAKPDVAFTGTDNFELGVLLNANCYVPVVSPTGPVTVCSGNTARLTASGAAGVTYSWELDGTALGVNTPFIDASAAGDYTVVATSSGGTCSTVSNAVTVTVIGGAGGAPTATNNGPVCAGADLELYTPDVPGATFAWTGPNGFSSNQQNPVLPNFDATMVGTYQVVVTLGACVSAPGSTDVAESTVPDFTISTADPTTFCIGESAVLSITGASGLSYQWQLDGAPISGANTTSYTATQSGDYTVEVRNADNCTRITSPLNIATVPPPTADFNSADEACINLPISFTDASVVQSSQNVFYNWDFGDGNTSTEANPSHTYTALGNYTVSLLVHYDDTDCNDTFTKDIDVVNSPAVAILYDRDTVMCENDTITLSIEDVHNAYSWSTGSTSSSITVTTAGIYSVDVTTTAGCVATASIEVVTLPLPNITVSADIDQIFAGDTVQLSASGGITYQWSPVEGLDDPNIPNPIANPVTTTTYTVTADGPNGCFGSAEITINVGEGINVNPKPLFSPNNDGQNDLWTIGNIDRYPDCTVIIVNRQGNVLYERRPYFGNEWDGTLNGNPVIEGAYYFVIRCEGSSQNAASGSVTLIR